MNATEITAIITVQAANSWLDFYRYCETKQVDKLWNLWAKDIF